MVYFIWDSKTNEVKIGCSKNPYSRRKELQRGNAGELFIVALMPGDRAVESEYHGRFAEHRVRGEWFRLEGSLKDYIAENRLDSIAIPDKPPSEGGLCHLITVRLKPSENAELVARAKKHGMTVSKYIRHLLATAAELLNRPE